MGLTTKKCTQCGEIKLLSEFGKRYNKNNTLRAECKICYKKTAHNWYINKREIVIKRSKKWKNENRKRINELQRTWYAENKDSESKRKKLWNEQNPEMAKEKRKRDYIKRRSTLKGRLNNRLSCSIRNSMKSGAKGKKHWEDLVDFTTDQLKKHLEKLFKPGMTWENYGTYWQIDHKIPIAVFNYDKPEHIDFRLCWSLKNLQPLEKEKNLSKNAKIDKHFQPSLAM